MSREREKEIAISTEKIKFAVQHALFVCLCFALLITHTVDFASENLPKDRQNCSENIALHKKQL